MFANESFYFGQVRLYIALFGKMFSDILIQRRDKNNTLVQVIPVPIDYGPAAKWDGKTSQDPDFHRSISRQLPRMSYEMMGMQYLPERQTPPLQKATRVFNKEKLYSQFKHVFYEFKFNLYVVVENESDGLQIVEQIIPFFAPDWTVKTNVIPDMQYEDDTKIEIKSIDVQRDWTGSMGDGRKIEWTIGFTMEAKLYGNVRKQGPIKRAEVRYYALPGSEGEVTREEINNAVIAEMTVTRPGLTADGQPTKDPDETIPYQQISFDDNWDFIQEVFSFVGTDTGNT